MRDEELIRYSRHILLPSLGMQGQAAIAESRVLLVGAGGLGSASAIYLAASGIGELIVNDFDLIEITNLPRQIVYEDSDLGLSKASRTASRLSRMNPHISVTAITEKLTFEQLEETAASVDAVLDGSDNFETRFTVNSACVRTGTPLVSASAIGFRGQITVYDPRIDGAPCYACIFPPAGEELPRTCSENGVFSPLVGVIGTLQAAAALKICAGLDSGLAGQLLTVDTLTMEFKRTSIQADPQCPACGGTADGQPSRFAAAPPAETSVDLA